MSMGWKRGASYRRLLMLLVGLGLTWLQAKGYLYGGDPAHAGRHIPPGEPEPTPDTPEPPQKREDEPRPRPPTSEGIAALEKAAGKRDQNAAGIARGNMMSEPFQGPAPEGPPATHSFQVERATEAPDASAEGRHWPEH
jgi:hypothetical protein